jgi:hypothetical protein
MPDRRPQAQRDLLQQLITDLVAQPVVDGLELVDVAEQEPDVVLTGAGQGLVDPLAQLGPVGQPGQRVVGGAVAQFPFALP